MPVDLDALAAEYGGQAAQAAPAPATDLDALAAEFGGSVATADAAPTITKLAPRDFDLEVAKRVRSGQSAQEIRDWATTVRDPNDPTGTVIRTIGPELEQVVENVRGGSNIPVEVLDVTKGDPLMAALRGGLDALSFNNADEIAAGVKAMFGDSPYEEYVRQERAARAIDAQTNPNERLLGEAVGTVASTAVPLGRVLDAPKLLGWGGRVVRGAGVGGAMSGLSGFGAAQDVPEALDRLPADVLTGATIGGVLPAVGAGARYVKNNLTDQGSATSALEALGLSPAVLRAEAEAFRQATGRAPTVADVVGPRIERLRATLAGANETRYAAADAAETAAKELQTGILERTTPRTKAAQDMFDNAERRGDIEFAKFRDVQVQLPNTDQVFLAKAVIEEPGALGALKANDRQRIEASVNAGTITGGDLDLLRRSLRKQSRTDMGVTYSTLAEQVEEIMTNSIPDATRAVRNYARRMNRAEGVEKVGEKALTASRADFAAARNRPELRAPSGISAADQAILDALPPKDRGRLARQGGASIGASNAVAAKAGDNAEAAYALATDLESNSNAAANIRLAMPAQQAEDLIRYVSAQKRAVDNLLALAGVPAESVPTVIGDAGQMIKAATIAAQGGGAAIVSNLITNVARELGLGRGPALKLAENLFNPNQFEFTMRQLEKRGFSNNRITQAVRNGFFKVAAEIDKDNTRPPEGTVTVGPPQ